MSYGYKLGYRLVDGTNLKIESMSMVINNRFLPQGVQYVTHIVDKNTDIPLTPIFATLKYDEEDELFYIDDYLYLKDQLVHLYLVLDHKLSIIGNIIYNDYFDSIDFITGFGNHGNDFATYQLYKASIINRISKDKERRNKEHKRIHNLLIKRHKEKKES